MCMDKGRDCGIWKDYGGYQHNKVPHTLKLW